MWFARNYTVAPAAPRFGLELCDEHHAAQAESQADDRAHEQVGGSGAACPAQPVRLEVVVRALVVADPLVVAVAPGDVDAHQEAAHCHHEVDAAEHDDLGRGPVEVGELEVVLHEERAQEGRAERGGHERADQGPAQGGSDPPSSDVAGQLVAAGRAPQNGVRRLGVACGTHDCLFSRDL